LSRNVQSKIDTFYSNYTSRKGRIIIIIKRLINSNWDWNKLLP